MDALNAFYLRSDNPRLGGKLRVAPSNDPACLVGQIRPHTPLIVASWWPEGCFLKVRLVESGPPYFVNIAHVAWTTGACGPYQSWVPLDNNAWVSTSWPLYPCDFWIKLTHGIRIDEMVDAEQTAINSVLQNSKRKKLIKQQETRYTYCALELGSPLLCPVHASIGYLLDMGPIDVDALRKDLTDIVETWRLTLPLDRPKAILEPRLRRFRLKRDEDFGFDCETNQTIVEWTTGEVDRALVRGSLELIRAKHEILVDADKYAAETHRLHQRDIGRVSFAAERARQMPNSIAERIALDCADSALGGDGKSLALADLLHYLHDCIQHKSVTYTHDEKGKLVPPVLLSPNSWHVTRHDDWQLAPRM